MKTKKLLMLAALGAAAYFAYKKRSVPKKYKKPGPVSSFFTEMGESIKKPLDEVAEDIPEKTVRPGGLHQTGLS